MAGVRLPEDLDLRLSMLAAKTRRSKSYYMKEAISEYLDEYEKIYQAVSEYEVAKKNGTLKTYTLDELMQRNEILHDDLAAEIDKAI